MPVSRSSPRTTSCLKRCMRPRRSSLACTIQCAERAVSGCAWTARQFSGANTHTTLPSPLLAKITFWRVTRSRGKCAKRWLLSAYHPGGQLGDDFVGDAAEGSGPLAVDASRSRRCSSIHHSDGSSWDALFTPALAPVRSSQMSSLTLYKLCPSASASKVIVRPCVSCNKQADSCSVRRTSSGMLQP